MTDYMKLVDILIDELPEEHPWKGNIKGLVEKLIANGVTIPVRCKDCKHWKDDLMRDDLHICEIGYYFIEENGYCSYGERREGK